MGNSQIRFTEKFVFRLLKGFTTIWEGSTTFKLYSVEVCFYQTSRFVTLEENIRQKRSFLGFLKQYFWFVFALSFHLGYLKLLWNESSYCPSLPTPRVIVCIIWIVPLSCFIPKGYNCITYILVYSSVFRTKYCINPCKSYLIRTVTVHGDSTHSQTKKDLIFFAKLDS